MAITIVRQTTFFEDAAGATTTKAHGANFQAGSSVIVTFSEYNGTNLEVTAVSVNGTAAVKDSGQLDSGGSSSVATWRATNVAGGGANVVITHGDSSGSYIVGDIIEVTGLSASPFIASYTAYDNTSVDPVTYTSADGTGTPAIGDLVICTIDVNRTALNGALTNLFEAGGMGAGMTGSGVYKIASGSGNQSVIVDAGIFNRSVVLGVYQANTAAAAPSLPIRRAFKPGNLSL